MKVLLLFIAIQLLTAFAFAQTRDLGPDEFEIQLAAVRRKALGTFPRSEIETLEMKQDGRFVGKTVRKTETTSFDNIRMTIERDSAGKHSELEFRRVANNFYCDDRSGAWKILGSYCLEQIFSPGLGGKPLELTITQNPDGTTIFRRYALSAMKDYFREERFYVNAGGAIEKEVTKDGLPGSGRVTYTLETVRNFNAPIVPTIAP